MRASGEGAGGAAGGAAGGTRGGTRGGAPPDRRRAPRRRRAGSAAAACRAQTAAPTPSGCYPCGDAGAAARTHVARDAATQGPVREGGAVRGFGTRLCTRTRNCGESGARSRSRAGGGEGSAAGSGAGSGAGSRTRNGRAYRERSGRPAARPCAPPHTEPAACAPEPHAVRRGVGPGRGSGAAGDGACVQGSDAYAAAN